MENNPEAKPKIILAGHSLGAAEAAIYAWSRLARGLPVDGLYLFGCPNPGDSQLGTALAQIPTKVSYKNGRDLVMSFPVDLPMFNEEYCQPLATSALMAKPVSSDPWGIFSWHHMELYLAACAGQPAAPIAQACLDIYSPVGTSAWSAWLADGFFATRTSPGAILGVFRSTTNIQDLFVDLNCLQILILQGSSQAKLSAGFWSRVGRYMDELDRLLQ